jgi:hypothetical protein
VAKSFRRKIQHAGSGSANSPAMPGAWSVILANWLETLNVKKIFVSLGDENHEVSKGVLGNGAESTGWQ